MSVRRRSSDIEKITAVMESYRRQLARARSRDANYEASFPELSMDDAQDIIESVQEAEQAFPRMSEREIIDRCAGQAVYQMSARQARLFRDNAPDAFKERYTLQEIRMHGGDLLDEYYEAQIEAYMSRGYSRRVATAYVRGLTRNIFKSE